MNRDPAAENLAVVDAHFQSEAARDITPALQLYTDDVVWESPARQLSLHGKRAAADNYSRTFAAMSHMRLDTLRRFATDEPGGRR